MCHADPSCLLKVHSGILAYLTPIWLYHMPQLSTQDSHNSLRLMRRWELHPHRWILFLWPAERYCPTTASLYSYFFLAEALIHQHSYAYAVASGQLSICVLAQASACEIVCVYANVSWARLSSVWSEMAVINFLWNRPWLVCTVGS